MTLPLPINNQIIFYPTWDDGREGLDGMIPPHIN